MSKRNRTRGSVSIRGSLYDRIAAEADRRGVQVAALVESQLVAMLDQHDAHQRALAEAFPPKKRRHTSSRFNRPVP